MNIVDYIKKLPEKDKIEVVAIFHQLLCQFLPYSGLPDPHYLFFDNNILQDVLKHHTEPQRKLRFLGTSLFSDFLEKHIDFDVRIALSPAILYELNGKRHLSSQEEYEALIKKAATILNIFSLKVYSVGFQSHKDLKKIFRNIRHDEKKLKKIISSIKQKKWIVNLRNGHLVTFPFAAAMRLAPKRLKLKYFHDYYARWQITSLIEQSIVKNRENDKYARKNLRSSFTSYFAYLFQASGENLKGLGDIELLSYCDLSAQFQNECSYTNVALTFDSRLETILHKRHAMPVSHEPIYGHDSDEERKRKLNQLWRGESRLTKIQERVNQNTQKASIYLQDLVYSIDPKNQ